MRTCSRASAAFFKASAKSPYFTFNVKCSSSPVFTLTDFSSFASEDATCRMKFLSSTFSTLVRIVSLEMGAYMQRRLPVPSV